MNRLEFFQALLTRNASNSKGFDADQEQRLGTKGAVLVCDSSGFTRITRTRGGGTCKSMGGRPPRSQAPIVVGVFRVAGILAGLPLLGMSLSARGDDRPLPWEEARIQCLLAKARVEQVESAIPGSERELACRDSLRAHAQMPVSGEEGARRFRDELCRRPERACDALVSQLQSLPSTREDGSLDLRGVPMTSSCEPHPLWIQKQMDTPEEETSIATALRQRTGAATTVAAVYQGPQWEAAKRLVEATRSTLLEGLSRGDFQAPPAVLDRIRRARLLDPNDPSIPAEQKKALLDNCGVSATGERTPPLGVLNAFANDQGWVVICPKMLLSTPNPAALGMILLHEMGHLVGPCLTGFQLGSMRNRGEDATCRLPTDTASEAGQLVAWRTGLLRQEACFHEAGLNEGRIPGWATREMRSLEAIQEEAAELAGEAPSECGPELRDFIASPNPREGLLSACDPSQLYLSLSVSLALDRQMTSSRARKLQTALRSLRAMREMRRPNHNQYDESFSDYLASRFLPQVLDRVGARAQTGALQGVDEALGFSTLCDVARGHSLRNEVHPEGDRRMAIFASQLDIRERLGCGSLPLLREGPARSLARCRLNR